MMPPWIAELAERRETGLAVHYPLIWSLVVGLEARRVFEFGAGPSSAVLLDALEHASSDGEHLLESIGTDPTPACARPACRAVGAAWSDHGGWRHLTGLSQEMLPPQAAQMGPFDFVLHDGSHAADVVASDLRLIVPHVRQFGMLAIHDTQHSYSGEEMRRGVREGLQGVDYTAVTLPYGYGLTLVRIEASAHPSRVLTREKVGSPHRTEPCEIWERSRG